MPESFQCPNCAKRYVFNKDSAGRRTTCRECGHSFRVPDAAPPAHPAASARKPIPARQSPSVQPVSHEFEDLIDESPSLPAGARLKPPLSPLMPIQPPDRRSFQWLRGTSRDQRKKLLYSLLVVGALSASVLFVCLVVPRLGTSAVDRASTGLQPGSTMGPGGTAPQSAPPLRRKGFQQLCDEIVANLTDSVNLLSSIHDEASLRATTSKLSALASQQAELCRAMKNPQAIDVSMIEAPRVPAIEAAFRAKYESLQQRLGQELMRISNIPGAFELGMELRLAAGNTDAPVGSGGGGGPGGDPVAQALAAIKSQDFGNRMSGLFQLSRLTPTDNHRKEVAAALAELVLDEDPGTRSTAMQLLATWYVPESIPKMIQLTRDPDPSTRFAAIAFLANIHDSPEAAQAVAERFVQDGLQAAMALQSMGPVAEESVWPYLNHEDRMVRIQAFQTLSAIGTQKSLAKLAPLANDEDFGTRTYAQQVINAIRSRP